MKEGPVIASVAALLGDPARANILTALMDGRALTVSELAEAAGVTLQTASGHLAKLDAANLLTAEKQGRHRYFRLSGPDVAQVLEALMGLAQRTGATRIRTGPKDAALRSARICYDHLAGERGVALLRGVQRQGLVEGGQDLALTPKGRAFFADFGIDLTKLEKGRRPVCRACLDWSERHSHLGGALGAAILSRMTDRGWVRRESGRVLAFTCEGAAQFEAAFMPAQDHASQVA
ncbi:ArsR/SmtB family transcription factor [Microvirga lotononidis]|uniref:Putative transcriptional regulator n=1 Tax=Microvirga lotononidis TaxID=864069 RepID=I4YYW5_9HYPH|nr:winged helix-turn-helix domain-containing protein [Microvirga lotononidis]EIM29157.1 putative transcriptional regulator [Microvirga lotononidis]WQO28998.1 winged helix-turn-helix domain-containing protein [Microvirga lotononidis]